MNKLDKYTFYIVFIDVFFLPLFPLVSVSMSLPVIAYWYIKRGRRTHVYSEYRLLPLAVCMMALSSIISLIYPGEISSQTSFDTTIKRFFMFWTAFWYFLFFKYVFVIYEKSINRYVFWCIVYMAFVALIYMMFQEQFIHYKSIINPADPHTRRYLADELGGVYRYTFLWSDANNVAYALVALLLFYLQEEHNSEIKKYIALFSALFVLLCTMSIGGIGIAMFLLAYTFIFTNALKTKGTGFVVSLCCIILISFAIIYYWDLISEFLDNGLASRYEKYDSNDNMSGGRLADLQRSFKRMSPLFIAIGSGLEGFTGENGHLYLICMYGFPVYLYFLTLFFAKRKGISFNRYISLIPFFVGFTMNIAIIEQKYLLLLLIMSAFFSADSYKYKMRLKKNKEVIVPLEVEKSEYLD